MNSNQTHQHTHTYTHNYTEFPDRSNFKKSVHVMQPNSLPALGLKST